MGGLVAVPMGEQSHSKGRFPAGLSLPPLSAQGCWWSSLSPLGPICSCTAPRRAAGPTSRAGTTPPSTSSSSSPASWTSSRTPGSSCRSAWTGSRCPWLCSLKVTAWWCMGEGAGWGRRRALRATNGQQLQSPVLRAKSTGCMSQCPRLQVRIHLGLDSYLRVPPPPPRTGDAQGPMDVSIS